MHGHELLLASCQSRITTLRDEATCMGVVREGPVGHRSESTVASARSVFFVVCEWVIGRLLQWWAS